VSGDGTARSVLQTWKAMGSDPVSVDNDHCCLLQLHPLRPLRNSGPQSAALDLLLVMTRRCQRAMDLLRQPDLTVADVSDAAGYSSPAYFIASFRQQLGVTPGAYQRAVARKG